MGYCSRKCGLFCYLVIAIAIFLAFAIQISFIMEYDRLTHDIVELIIASLGMVHLYLWLGIATYGMITFNCYDSYLFPPSGFKLSFCAKVTISINCLVMFNMCYLQIILDNDVLNNPKSNLPKNLLLPCAFFWATLGTGNIIISALAVSGTITPIFQGVVYKVEYPPLINV